MKRSFKFNGTDVELEIKKAVSIDTPKKMVVLEEMKSGKLLGLVSLTHK